MKRPFAAWLVLGSLAGFAPATAQTAAEAVERLDRIVAVVDDDLILQSEIERALTFGLSDLGADPPRQRDAVERRVLDQLIEQRLRFHEAERYDLAPVPAAEVERQIAEISRRFGGSEALDVQLAAAELDRDLLRERIRRQLRVLAFVDERLSARVFVAEEAVLEHYESVLVTDLVARGAAVPPLDAVRDEIRQLLEERALAEEVAQWTAELRRRARILDLLDRPVDLDNLPPVVERVDSTHERPPPRGVHPPSRR